MSVPVSPAELLLDFLQTNADPLIVLPANIVVGPGNREQQEAGCVELTDAGMPKQEHFPTVVWVRSQVRCIAGSLSHVDRIGRHVWETLNNKNRVLAHQASTNEDYLLHVINLAAGPSHHYDSPVTYEALMFAEIMVGTQAVA